MAGSNPIKRGPSGITSATRETTATAIKGAERNRKVSARRGNRFSWRSSTRASATGESKATPMRLGPTSRSCCITATQYAPRSKPSSTSKEISQLFIRLPPPLQDRGSPRSPRHPRESPRQVSPGAGVATQRRDGATQLVQVALHPRSPDAGQCPRAAPERSHAPLRQAHPSLLHAPEPIRLPPGLCVPLADHRSRHPIAREADFEHHLRHAHFPGDSAHSLPLP